MDQMSQAVFASFTLWDIAAVALFIVLWNGAGFVVEHPPRARPSTHVPMDRFRSAWMVEMSKREVRLSDSQVVNGQRQATEFFTSTALLAIGGGTATITQAEAIAIITDDLALELTQPLATLELKVLAVSLMMTLVFLKFVWANRLLGYGSTVMAAMPAPGEPDALKTAQRAGRLANTAARSFNRGLRAVYFALALLAWLLGPVALALAVVATTFVIWRREFMSESRRALLEE